MNIELGQPGEVFLMLRETRSECVSFKCLNREQGKCKLKEITIENGKCDQFIEKKN